MGQTFQRANWLLCGLLLAALATGCCHNRNKTTDECYGNGRGGSGGDRRGGPPYDRPFPLGQVTDSFWETQQTNAEAADFIFFDHEFQGDTANLAPGGIKHLTSVALRLEHVPFPVVVEESPYNRRPDLDAQRRRTIVEQLGRLGVPNAEERVVVTNAFAEGFTAVEGERAYYDTIYDSFGQGGGIGHRFGGTGSFYR